MKVKPTLAGFSVLAMFLGAQLYAVAASHESEKKMEIGENEESEEFQAEPLKPEEVIKRAVTVLEEQLGQSPDKRLPAVLLQKAKCVAILPDVVQGGLIWGGKVGSGVVVCRHEESRQWGAPAFVNMGGASVGLQFGVKTADLVLLAMTSKGLNQLLSGKPIVGGEASVAAGPVGRNASANIDVLLQTPLISYSRSKGLFAGLSLEGVVIGSSKDANREVYGEYRDAKELLLERTEAPEVVNPIRDVLERYAPSKKQS